MFHFFGAFLDFCTLGMLKILSRGVGANSTIENLYMQREREREREKRSKNDQKSLTKSILCEIETAKIADVITMLDKTAFKQHAMIGRIYREMTKKMTPTLWVGPAG